MRLFEIENLHPGDIEARLSAVGSSYHNPQKRISLFKKIENDCSDIVNLYIDYFHKHGQWRFFRRGTPRGAQTLAYYGRSHEQRRPKDTPDSTHRWLVDTMVAAGFTAHRGNSIFVRAGPVESYGPTFLIFPVSGFHYSFSPKVVDLYSRLLDEPTIMAALKDRYSGPGELSRKMVRDYYTEKLGYKIDEGLMEALEIDRDPEVMISGNYYGIRERAMDDYVIEWLQGLA